MSKKKQSIISKWQYATITLSLLSIIAAFSIFFHSKGSLVTSASEEMIDPELMSKCENYLVGYLYKSKHPEVKWEVPASELLELWLRECSGFRITLPSYASSARSLPSSLLYINRFLEPLDYIEPNQVYAREFSVRDNSLKAISNVSIAESTGSGRFVAAKVNKTNFKLTSTAPLPKGIYGVTVKLEGSTDDGKKIVKNFYRAINVGFTDESSAPETPKLFITSPISGNVTSNVQVSGVATGVSKLTVTYTCASQRGSVDVVPVPNTGAWTTSLSLKLCSVGNIVIISASGISPDGMVVVAPSVRVTRR